MIPHSLPWFNQTDIEFAVQVFKNKTIVGNKELWNLENKLAQYIHKKHALSTGNGSQALWLILKYLNVKPTDEIILPSYVCDKVYNTIVLAGAKPILCDIGNNYCMDYDSISKKISTKTKAIILVHMYGVNAWNNKFKEFNVPIIEDVCQSLGHVNAETRTGSYSDFAFTSFHAIKCLPIGNGGMLFVNNEQTVQAIQKIAKKSPLVTEMTEYQAVIGNAMFDRYEQVLAKRNYIANFYTKHIKIDSIKNNKIDINSSMNYRFVMESSKDFEKIKSAFLENGIHVRKGVDSLIHTQVGKKDTGFKNTMHAFNHAISLPILPTMEQAEIENVVNTCNKLHKNGQL